MREKYPKVEEVAELLERFNLIVQQERRRELIDLAESRADIRPD
jgi:hypothetical protein